MGKQEWKAPESIAYCDAKGATLIDEFAGRVLQGIYSDTAALNTIYKKCGSDRKATLAEIASRCYDQAQAMIEERKKYVPC